MSISVNPQAAFVSDKRGSVAIVFAVSFAVLLGAVGLAVDSSRVYAITTKLQDGLDTSALAVARYLSQNNATDAEVTAYAKDFFLAKSAQLGFDNVTITELVVVPDRDSGDIQLDINVGIPAVFANLLGFKDGFNFQQSASSKYGVKKIELAMVLDLSGSMADNGKIDALKSAAKAAIDILFDASTDENNTRISLAPYAAAVNAGPYSSSVSSTAGVDTCVIERRTSDLATNATVFVGGYLEKGGTPVDPLDTNDPFYYYDCPASEVISLSGKSSRDDLKSSIDGYVPNTGTAGHIGTAWGWYTLSNAWGSVFSDNPAPAPNGNANLEKHVLIMTDGLFSLAYIDRDSTTPRSFSDQSYETFQSLCQGMKNEGITVWTIVFDLNDAQAETEMRNCSSGPPHFYSPSTNEELETTFLSIAKNLSSVYLSN